MDGDGLYGVGFTVWDMYILHVYVCTTIPACNYAYVWNVCAC